MLLDLPEELISLVICAVASSNQAIARRAKLRQKNIPGDPALAPLSVTSRQMRRLTLPIMFSRTCVYYSAHATDVIPTDTALFVRVLIIVDPGMWKTDGYDHLQKLLQVYTLLEHVQIPHSIWTRPGERGWQMSNQQALASHPCTTMVTNTKEPYLVQKKPSHDLRRTSWELVNVAGPVENNMDRSYLAEYLERGLRVQVLKIGPRGSDSWKRLFFAGISTLKIDLSGDLDGFVNREDMVNFQSRHPTLRDILVVHPHNSSSILYKIRDLLGESSILELRLTREHDWEVAEIAIAINVTDIRKIASLVYDIGSRLPSVWRLSVKAEFVGKFEDIPVNAFTVYPNVSHLILDLESDAFNQSIDHALSYPAGSSARQRFMRLLHLFLLRWTYGMASVMHSLRRVTFTRAPSSTAIGEKGFRVVVVREPLRVHEARLLDGEDWVMAGVVWP